MKLRTVTALLASAMIAGAGVGVYQANDYADNARAVKVERDRQAAAWAEVGRMTNPSPEGSYLLPSGSAGSPEQLRFMERNIDRVGVAGPDILDRTVTTASADGSISPGTYIDMIDAAGNNSSCSLGFTLTKGATTYATTAGHCALDGQRTVGYRNPDKTLARLGTISFFSDFLGSNGEPLGFITDAALIEVQPGVNLRSRIPGPTPDDESYDVVGFATPDDLPPGTIVCKQGFRTGETCGKVMAVRENAVRVNLAYRHGDSGSPSYIKTGKVSAQGHPEVLAVGWLAGGPYLYTGEENDFLADFYLAGPVADHLGMTLTPPR